MYEFYSDEAIVMRKSILDFYYSQSLKDGRNPIKTLVAMIKYRIEVNEGIVCSEVFVSMLEMFLEFHYGKSEGNLDDTDNGFDMFVGKEFITIHYNLEV